MDLEGRLAAALPGLRRSASAPDRIAYARDLWPRHHLAVTEGRIADHKPELVVWPESTDEVAALVRFASDEGTPLVPFGAGSGVCGAVLPTDQTIVVDLKRMKRWRALDPEDGTLEVESGALGITLEEDLADRGFTLGHFPSSILCSTVGGWIAARSAGQCSGRYGKIEDMVASLECVVAKGEVVRFERRTHGPDATPLLIGSEGIFGVITSARLRLHAKPASRAFASFSFRTVEAGWTAMREMFQAGLRPAVARLYDPFDSMMARMGAVRRGRRVQRGDAGEATRAASGGGPGAGGIALRSALRVPGLLNRVVDALGAHVSQGSNLILVFEASAEAEGLEDRQRATQIAERLGGRSMGEEPARHWLSHRYGVSYRQAPIFMAGAFCDTMEVAAPWSKLAGLYEAVRRALGRRVFVMAHLSHAYPDGCSIYFTFAGSCPTVAEAEAVYDATWRSALEAAIEAGGTLSHHHGVGRSKAPRLGDELGLGVEVIQALARAFDPAGIMNPKNLLPSAPPARRPASLPPATPELDRESMTVHVAGDVTLARVERALGAAGLTLGLGPDAPPLDVTTVDAWLAAGAKGAPDPWEDPVDHALAGFTARMRSGAELEVRPSPRRAVGPDLAALFVGAQHAAGTVISAHLRAHGAERPRPLRTTLARDPRPSATESDWIDRLLRAAASV